MFENMRYRIAWMSDRKGLIKEFSGCENIFERRWKDKDIAEAFCEGLNIGARPKMGRYVVIEAEV